MAIEVSDGGDALTRWVQDGGHQADDRTRVRQAGPATVVTAVKDDPGLEVHNPVDEEASAGPEQDHIAR